MTTDEHRARREPGQHGARPRLGPPRRAGTALLAAVCVTVLFPTVAQSSQDEAAAELNPVDDLSSSEIAEIVADEAFVLEGDEILVEDLAPFGPDFIDPEEEAAAASGDGPVEAIGIDEAFSLHSRPGATRKILLDFDGQVVTGTSWNSGNEIVVGPYQRSDSSPAFTQTELDAIAEVWERVAEDFAPWDVDVTTEDPGAAGLSKTSPTDVEYGIRTIITPDYEWYDTRRFGGVAYLWSFTRSSDMPAWVFSSNLNAGNPKSVAEAVAHEVGHSLGLRHDGTASASYYSGHGQWAPIMGVGYSKAVTQWSDGSYPDASNTEDDLGLIDEMLARVPGGDSALPSSGPSETEHTLAVSGATQIHSLEVTEGPVTITVDKLDSWGNLLADLVVRDPLGQVVASSTPLHPATWSLTASLPAGIEAGVYTVEVESVGWAGSGSGDHGFPSYGSLGRYVVEVDMPGSTTTTTVPSSTTPTTTTPGSSPTTEPPGTEPPPSEGDRLTPISPLRVLDTRTASSPTSGRLRSGQNLQLGLDNAPAGATAAIVNVVAVNPTGDGWLSLTPCNSVEPDDRTSSINYQRGVNIANSVVVPLSNRSEVCIYASTTTHIVADVTGWIGSSGSLTLDEIGTQRVVDTRDGLGVARRLAAGTTTEIDLASMLSGDDVGAIALNVTAVRPSTRGYLTIDDCSADPDQTSSLNVEAGDVRGNNGVFALDPGQRLCVSTTTATHLTIDITGEFGTGNGLHFVAATPERVLDTRLREPLGPGASTAFTIPGATLDNGLSATPTAASVNVTAARPPSGGFVTAWNCGPRPETSALNPEAGMSTANGALVSLSPNGRSCLFHSAGGHLVVDLAGWWV